MNLRQQRPPQFLNLLEIDKRVPEATIDELLEERFRVKLKRTPHQFGNYIRFPPVLRGATINE